MGLVRDEVNFPLIVWEKTSETEAWQPHGYNGLGPLFDDLLKGDVFHGQIIVTKSMQLCLTDCLYK